MNQWKRTKAKCGGMTITALLLPLSRNTLPDTHGSVVQCEFSTVRKEEEDERRRRDFAVRSGGERA